MPTRRRTIAGSTVLEYRSSPWRRTVPSTRVFGTNSCIRLRQRRKVDFPQPLGPMIAVTAFDAISRVTSSMARFSPYQTERFFTGKVNVAAGSGVQGRSAARSRSITVRSGVAITKLTIRKRKLDQRCRTPASQNSNHHINAKNPGDEHERASPSLAMPIVIGRNGVSKNLQRKSGDRLTQIMVPKSIAKRREKERRSLAAHARQRQQNASDNSFGRGFHHDMYNRFPPAYAEGKRGFTIAVWHQQNNFFCRADDQRNHDQTKRESAGIRREAFETQHDQSVNHHAPGDRWNAIEHVGHKPQQRIHASRAVFGKVNSAQNAHRNSNYRSESEKLERTHNCVHHSAANYTGRLRQFGEEVPVHRTGAVSEQMKKYEPQRRDHKKSRNERDR